MKRSVWAAAAASGLILAACGQAGNASHAPAANSASAPSAAVNAPSATNGAAAGAETAPQFMARLVAALNDPNRAGSAAPLDPTFSKLMDDDGAMSARVGDVDLDSDPVCQCQDSGGHYVYVSGKPAADGLFHAQIRETSSQGPPWTLVLKQEGGAWVIYDVIDQSGDLRVWLAAHVACIDKYAPAKVPDSRAEAVSQQIDACFNGKG